MNDAQSVPRSVMFQHLIHESDEQFSLEFDYDTPANAYVRMEIDKEGDFWLSANQEGYLHLARVFAEMGIRPLEDGYHFHMNSDFRHSGGSREFSFEVDNSCGRGRE